MLKTTKGEKWKRKLVKNNFNNLNPMYLKYYLVQKDGLQNNFYNVNI